MKLNWGRYLAFLAISAVVYGIVFTTLFFSEQVGAFYLALPLFGLWQGIFAQLFLAKSQPISTIRLIGLITIGDLALSFGLAYLGLESAACLMMGLPIVLPASWGGIYLARRRGVNSSKLHMPAATLLLAAPLLDGWIAYPERRVIIEDHIIIDAPPMEIWSNLLSIPTIAPEELPHTFSHNWLGVPRPLSATFDGQSRVLEWTGGVVLREDVTRHEAGKRLAWTFDFFAPETLSEIDPHIVPNSKFTRLDNGAYDLAIQPDGTARLSLTTELIVATPLNAYFAPWGAKILGDFHTSILHVIKHRSEAS